MSKIDIAELYSVCVEIKSTAFADNFAPLPAEFQNQLATCGSELCDVVGSGKFFKVSRQKLMAMENFLTCQSCWQKAVNTQEQARPECRCCKNIISLYDKKYLNYFRYSAKGSGFVCASCAALNRFYENDKFCPACENYYTPSKSTRGRCEFCTKNYAHCTSCMAFHPKTEKLRNVLLTGQMEIPEEIVVVCKTNVRTKISLVSIKELINREYKSLREKKHKNIVINMALNSTEE